MRRAFAAALIPAATPPTTTGLSAMLVSPRFLTPAPLLRPGDNQFRHLEDPGALQDRSANDLSRLLCQRAMEMDFDLVSDPADFAGDRIDLEEVLQGNPCNLGRDFARLRIGQDRLVDRADAVENVRLSQLLPVQEISQRLEQVSSRTEFDAVPMHLLKAPDVHVSSCRSQRVKKSTRRIGR